MKVYLDNCCFNRPFDDQKQLRIRLETQAKLAIQEMIKSEELQLAWSFMMDYENSQNTNKARQYEINKWANLAVEYNIGNENVLALAQEFQEIGIKKKDSLHLACAVESKCEYLITTDDGILKKAKVIKEINIINPVDFIIFSGGQ
ncbi:MAG: PIN domain protein [Leptospirales bacterium]